MKIKSKIAALFALCVAVVSSVGAGAGTFFKSHAEENAVIPSAECSVTVVDGFYFNHDPKPFNIGHIQRFKLTDENGDEVTPDMSLISFKERESGADNPKDAFNRNNSSFAYKINVYYNGVLLFDTNTMKPVEFTAYIGTKGDMNLNNITDAVDASDVMYYYCRNFNGDFINDDERFRENPVLADFSAFLADVDNDAYTVDNWKILKEERTINPLDASYIYSMYATMSRGCDDLQEAWDISIPDRAERMEKYIENGETFALSVDDDITNGLSQSKIDDSENQPTIIASYETVCVDGLNKDRTQTVTISAKDADKLYSAVGLVIYYDSRLKLKVNSYGKPSVECGKALEDFSVKGVYQEDCEGPYNRIIIAAVDYEDSGRDGEMFTISFELPKNAKEGDFYPVKIGNDDYSIFTSARNDEDRIMQAYAFTRGIMDGGIAVTGAALCGDANGDGKVSIADATAIVQAIGNPDRYGLSETGKKNADCYNTGDGVTGLDALAIQKLQANIITELPDMPTKK